MPHKRVDLALDRRDHERRRDDDEDDRDAGEARGLLGELAHVLMDDLVRAAGQRVLEQERLERVEPLLEHRETRDERERDGGERDEAQQSW